MLLFYGFWTFMILEGLLQKGTYFMDFIEDSKGEVLSTIQQFFIQYLTLIDIAILGGSFIVAYLMRDRQSGVQVQKLRDFLISSKMIFIIFIISLSIYIFGCIYARASFDAYFTGPIIMLLATALFIIVNLAITGIKNKFLKEVHFLKTGEDILFFKSKKKE